MAKEGSFSNEHLQVPNAQCVVRLGLQGSTVSLFSAKRHCFSRTGFPGMLVVSSRLLLH